MWSAGLQGAAQRIRKQPCGFRLQRPDYVPSNTAGHTPWPPGARVGQQRAAAAAVISSRRNQHSSNLLILHCFATQKLLLSTQARNDFLSHGGHSLSCVLTPSLS